MRNIENRVREIVLNMLELKMTNDDLLSDTELQNIGMNSISFVKLIVEIENQFNIEVPDDKLLITEAGTIKKLSEIIESCVK